MSVAVVGVPSEVSARECKGPLRLTRRASANKRAPITFREIRFTGLISIILCAITTLPYVAGQRLAAPGTAFTGVIEHSLDVNNYLAYANQAAAGRWLFGNPMTPEVHGNVFFNLEWLVIGKVAAALHISLAGATGVLRLMCLVLMCFGVYWLSSFLVQSVFTRRIALVAIMSGGGFGWIAAVHLLHVRLGSSYFIDLSNGNLFPFYWALKLPHFLISESMVVLGLCCFLRGEESARARDYVLAGVFFMSAGACRPYDMLFVMAAIGAYLVIQHFQGTGLRPGIALRIVPAMLCVPVLAYYFWIFKIHPVFKWWSLPGNPAPMPWLLALGFGMSFLLLPVAAWRLRARSLSDPEKLMICCLFTAVVLSYSHRLFHFSFQFATNILAPMVLITLAALEPSITACTRKRQWRGALIAVLVANSFSSIALAGQATLLAAKGDFGIDVRLVEAYSWLNTHSRTDDIVLANFERSGELPDYSHDVVFCGYLNAVNIQQKFAALKQFFNSRNSNQFRAEFVRRIHARFVLLSASEEGDLHLGTAGPFKEVFRNGAAVIFVAPEGFSSNGGIE